MTILVIILAVALVASMRIPSAGREDLLRKVRLALVLATATAAAVKVWKDFSPPASRQDLSPVQQLGIEIAKSFPAGDVLVVRMPPSMIGRTDASDPHMQDLLAGIRGTELRLVGMDCESQSAISGAWQRVFSTSKPDADVFRQYLRVYTGVVAVVSLVGLPACAPADLPQPLPPFYVLGNSRDFTNVVWQSSGRIKRLVVLQ